MRSPEVNLVATCGAAVPAATCTRLQNEVQQEEAELAADATDYEWYPVVGVGVAIRF